MDKENENSIPPLTGKVEIITNQKLILELDKQDLYIPPGETWETFDQEMLRQDVLKKSANAIGQHSPISVAVWVDDPNKESDISHERVHLRIIDGRHRYKQNPKWKRQYISVNSFEQYCKYRLNIDLKKNHNPKEKEMLFGMMGRYLLKQGCQYEKIGSTLCKMYPEMHSSQILRYLPSKWKDPTKAHNRLGKIKLRDVNETKKIQQELENPKDQEIKKLEYNLKEAWNENSELKKHLLTLEDRHAKDSSRLKILEEAEQEVNVEGVGKIKIKLEKDGISYIITKVTK